MEETARSFAIGESHARAETGTATETVSACVMRVGQEAIAAQYHLLKYRTRAALNSAQAAAIRVLSVPVDVRLYFVPARTKQT